MTRNRWLLLTTAVVALALLAAGCLVAPLEVARAWLAALLIFSSAPIGAVALKLILVMTGGRWGAAAEPTLTLAAMAMPLAVVFFVMLCLALRWTYPWAHDPSAAAPDVARWYLNGVGFAIRGIVALVGWTLLARAASVALGPLAAGLGLVFHGLAVSAVATDWALSLAPRFSDSAIGMELAVQQIMLALAFVGITQPARATGMAKTDIGALLLTMSLASFYFGLMTLVVKWYGDQPADAAWYVTRMRGAPEVCLGLALAFGAATPIIALSWEKIRGGARGLRVASAAIVVGVIAHDLWLVDADAGAAGATLVALVAMSALASLVAPALAFRARAQEVSHA